MTTGGKWWPMTSQYRPDGRWGELVAELTGMLGSPDPDVRDRQA